MPGEELIGVAGWQLAEKPKCVELRLFWFTRGKGSEDSGVVATQTFEDAQAEEGRQFQFRLPESPYSFSGKLISLVWALELIVKPGNAVERLEITVAPEAREVLLK